MWSTCKVGREKELGSALKCKCRLVTTSPSTVHPDIRRVAGTEVRLVVVVVFQGCEYGEISVCSMGGFRKYRLAESKEY